MTSADAAVSFLATVPILRSFDDQKARAFYLDFLGFEIVFEHRFAPDLPLYMEIVRAGLRLHLSEHHGDATPGSTVFIPMTGIQALHRELAAKHYSHARPGIEHAPWGDVLEVADPFGNRLRFCELKQSGGTGFRHAPAGLLRDRHSKASARSSVGAWGKSSSPLLTS